MDLNTPCSLHSSTTMPLVANSKVFVFGLNIFYLYILYIEQHIKTFNNICIQMGFRVFK